MQLNSYLISLFAQESFTHCYTISCRLVSGCLSQITFHLLVSWNGLKNELLQLQNIVREVYHDQMFGSRRLWICYISKTC